MTEKIPGEFLKIERNGDAFEISFVDGEGNPHIVKAFISTMNMLKERAPWEIKSIEQELARVYKAMNDPNAPPLNPHYLAKLKSELQHYRIQAVFPEMYVAHCRRENLGRFFQFGGSTMKTHDEPIESASTVQSVVQHLPKRKNPKAQRRTTPKKPWKRTKSEFCREIVAIEYDQHQERYKSKRQAAYILFDQYEFAGGWTKEACYELLRKV